MPVLQDVLHVHLIERAAIFDAHDRQRRTEGEGQQVEQPDALGGDKEALQQLLRPRSGPGHRRHDAAHLPVAEPAEVLAVVLGALPKHLVPAQVAQRHEGGEALPAALRRVEAPRRAAPLERWVLEVLVHGLVHDRLEMVEDSLRAVLAISIAAGERELVRPEEQIQLVGEAVAAGFFVRLLDQCLAELIHREPCLRRDLQEAFHHDVVAHRHRELPATACFDRPRRSPGDGRRGGRLSQRLLELRAVGLYADKLGGQLPKRRPHLRGFPERGVTVSVGLRELSLERLEGQRAPLCQELRHVAVLDGGRRRRCLRRPGFLPRLGEEPREDLRRPGLGPGVRRRRRHPASAADRRRGPDRVVARRRRQLEVRHRVARPADGEEEAVGGGGGVHEGGVDLVRRAPVPWAGVVGGREEHLAVGGGEGVEAVVVGQGGVVAAAVVQGDAGPVLRPAPVVLANVVRRCRRRRALVVVVGLAESTATTKAIREAIVSGGELESSQCVARM